MRGRLIWNLFKVSYLWIHEAFPKKFTIDMHIFRNISGIDVEHIIRKLHPEILI